MCGICGVVSEDPERTPLAAGALAHMADAIRHRGPDDSGSLLEPGVALAARRLKVIDPALSAQPIANEDRSVWAVFNGEIYNFRELRRELRRAGHALVTDGDTETIVHLYEEHGARFVERLRGMFAIAVWDRPRRRLVLARDRMGVKPLYVAQTPAGLAFASEVKSLIAGGLVDPRLDPLAAELFMAFGYVPGPATLFAGVRKLAPASTLVVEGGRQHEERRYWQPEDNRVEGLGTDWREDRERLLDLLRRAVRERMVSDVPLGAMLSGGLDSSLITALMAEASDAPVKTFAIGFEEDPRSELPDARAVAERLGTDHHELQTSALEHPDLLDETLWHLDEPVADLSAVGFLLLSRLARRSVTVALSGQGADELLGGYRKHQVAAATDRLGRAPAGVATLVAAGARRAPEGSAAALGATALAAGEPAARILAMNRLVQPGERPALFTREFLQAGAEGAIAASVRRRLPPQPRSALRETLTADAGLALVDLMLLYFDKASMATSLEVRVPFMDHRLVGFCHSLPDDRLVWRLRRKELLRRAARGLVEDRIIDKRKRGFFHAAAGTWLDANHDALVREVLLDERTRSRGQLRPEALEALASGNDLGGKRAPQRVLCVLLLEKWQRMFVDADGPGRRLPEAGAQPARASRT
jgi:asparagine synthase (glutamine-hydrolysing)